MPAVIALFFFAIIGGVILNPSGAAEGAKAEYRSAKAMAEYRPPAAPVARQSVTRQTAANTTLSKSSGSVDVRSLRWRRMSDEAVSSEMGTFARQVLEAHGRERRGSMYAKRMRSGKFIAGRLEEHYHSPESGKTPVGSHTGVTLYEAVD